MFGPVSLGTTVTGQQTTSYGAIRHMARQWPNGARKHKGPLVTYITKSTGEYHMVEAQSKVAEVEPASDTFNLDGPPLFQGTIRGRNGDREHGTVDGERAELVQIKVNVTKDEYRKLWAIKALQQTSLSDICRIAIERMLSDMQTGTKVDFPRRTQTWNEVRRKQYADARKYGHKMMMVAQGGSGHD